MARGSRTPFSSAKAKLVGPENSMLKTPEPTTIAFDVHRDRGSNAAVIEIQGQKIMLAPGQWSRWTKLDFALSMPKLVPTQYASGICRFYLQEVAPNFRLYLTPINIDPSDPAVQLSEPSDFIEDVSEELGLFYTTGFQEDHKARSNKVFHDAEYLAQAQYVLKERRELLDYAISNYQDGLLFFYFSSTDLQAHIFWWEGDDPHPVRSAEEAREGNRHIEELYVEKGRLDDVFRLITTSEGARRNG